MKEKILSLLGLMRRANAIAVGEVNTGSAARAGKAKLLLLASDASENARRRAEGFAAGRDVPLVELPVTKEELASSVGLSGGSMAAVTDLGFANALLKALAETEPERYGAEAQAMEERYARYRASTQVRTKRIGDQCRKPRTGLKNRSEGNSNSNRF